MTGNKHEPNSIFLVCAPWDSETEVPGTSYVHSCCECGQAVQVAPTGQLRLRSSVGPALKILCSTCFYKKKLKPQDTKELAADIEIVLREMASRRTNPRAKKRKQ